MEKCWVRSREACSVEAGLLHLLGIIGEPRMHLLALDMIPIAALTVFRIVQILFRCLPKL